MGFSGAEAPSSKNGSVVFPRCRTGDSDAFQLSMKFTMKACFYRGQFGDFDGIIQHLNPDTVIARLFSVFAFKRREPRFQLRIKKLENATSILITACCNAIESNSLSRAYLRDFWPQTTTVSDRYADLNLLRVSGKRVFDVKSFVVRKTYRTELGVEKCSLFRSRIDAYFCCS